MAHVSVPSVCCHFGCPSHPITHVDKNFISHERSESKELAKCCSLESNRSAIGTGQRINLSAYIKQTTKPLHELGNGTSCCNEGKETHVSRLLSAIQKTLTAKPCPRTKCQICGERFTSREKLFKHLRAYSHAPNWTTSVLLTELQTLRNFIQNHSNKHQLDHARWCLQQLATTVNRMKPQEARKISRARADNGATILHFLVDLWAAWSKTESYKNKSCSFVATLQQLASWAIRSSTISPELPLSHNKLPASSKTVWCGPWFSKCDGSQRRKYCGFQRAQQILQQAEMNKPLTDFFISKDKCWVHHDCKPGETALEVCTDLPFVRMHEFKIKVRYIYVKAMFISLFQFCHSTNFIIIHRQLSVWVAFPSSRPPHAAPPALKV